MGEMGDHKKLLLWRPGVFGNAEEPGYQKLKVQDKKPSKWVLVDSEKFHMVAEKKVKKGQVIQDGVVAQLASA
ncbi:unnamed protein product [Dovyalis caffra]|uniref:Uncharacterized protein n=1 Tax=Dovyalis caffra TaxID=77055 RepID=A0AAV1RB52_9ROSI|nr:unnamed protein product [Dovyalis caffra]